MPHRLVGVILQSKRTIELANHGRNHHFWHPWETYLYFVLCTPSDCYLSSYFMTETIKLKIASVKNHCETFEMSPTCTCRFSVILQKSKYKMTCIWRLTVVLAQNVAIMTKWLCCSLIVVLNPIYCWLKVKSMRFGKSKFLEYKFIYPERRELIWPHFDLIKVCKI